MVTLRGDAEIGRLRDAAPISQSPNLSTIIALAELETDETVEVDLLALAEQAEMTPMELENQLLAWHDQGLLRYRPAQRGALLELLPAPPDVSERIERLLTDYQARQDERVEAMGAYARAVRCRHRVLAAHFNQKLASCRTACDICAPERGLSAGGRSTTSGRLAGGPLPLRDDGDPRSDVARVLDGLNNMPFPMGRSGLARALKGGSSSPVEQDRCPEVGVLRHLPLSAIEHMIEQLIAEGYIIRDERDEYRRLSLSLSGKKARRDKAYLPEWA
jgi:ATP-dependent DNA helicase RecQ